jgi:purine-binding chemotaxis protein CheW
MQFVLFSLDRGRYALRLSVVDRVTRIVAITALPKAPGIVLGVVNVAGTVIPILDIRKRFGLPKRELDLSHQLIFARTSERIVGIVADAVTGVTRVSDHEVVRADKILTGLDYVDGVLKLEDGLTLIHDLDQFLSFSENSTLDEALRFAT